VRHYGTTARPLNDLMHQNAFSWNFATQEAFDQLKIAMLSTPVLAFPNFSKDLLWKLMLVMLELEQC
jgi:hypothetical protein